MTSPRITPSSSRISDPDTSTSTVEPEAPSVEDVAARYFAGRGGSPVSVPEPPRGKHRPATDREIAPLLARPEWQTIDSPQEVTAAWEAVEAAVAKLREVNYALRGLAGDQAAEARHVEAAIERGETPQPRDWTAEETVRTAAERVAIRQAHAARREYDVVVRAALPEWTERLTAELPEAHRKAWEAVQEAQEAYAAFVRALGAVNGVGRGADPARADKHQRLTQDDANTLHRGRTALDFARAFLRLTDPEGEALAANGGWVTTDDDGEVPVHTREAIAESGSNGLLTELMEVEAAEGYSVTAFTKEMPTPYQTYLDRRYGN